MLVFTRHHFTLYTCPLSLIVSGNLGEVLVLSSLGFKLLLLWDKWTEHLIDGDWLVELLQELLSVLQVKIPLQRVFAVNKWTKSNREHGDTVPSARLA